MIKNFSFTLLSLIGVIVFFASIAKAQTSSSGSISTTSNVVDTYTITLTNNTASNDVLKTLNGLNITVVFNNGAAKLDSGVNFKASGASKLLGETNADTGVISIALNGAITGGSAEISGMLKPGSVTGNPTISVTKIEKSGGVNITNDVKAVAVLSSSQAIQPSITNTGQNSGNNSSGSNNSGNIGHNGDDSGDGDTNISEIEIAGPEEIDLSLKGLNGAKFKVTYPDLTSVVKCEVETSDDSLLRIRPKKFLLSPLKKSKAIVGKVPRVTVKNFVKNKDSDIVTIDVTCSDDAVGETEVLINGE